ncbi:hypothetical protein BDW75DRAFT_197122 [Aspergillus navahoensis]
MSIYISMYPICVPSQRQSIHTPGSPVLGINQVSVKLKSLKAVDLRHSPPSKSSTNSSSA